MWSPEDLQVWSPGATWWHLQGLQMLHERPCRGEAEQGETPQTGREPHLILLVRRSILSIANADDDVGCAEPEVRVVSNVVDAHIFLFSNQLGDRMGCHEPRGLAPSPP